MTTIEAFFDDEFRLVSNLKYNIEKILSISLFVFSTNNI